MRDLRSRLAAVAPPLPARLRSVLNVAARAVLLAPGGTLAVLFLMEESPLVSTGPALLADVACTVLSGLAVAGAVVATFWWRLLPIAAAATVSLSLAVLVQAFSPQDLETPILALAAASLVLGFVMLHLSARDWRPHLPRATKAVLAVAALAAGPVFGLWQSTSYLPSQNAVSVSTQVGATHVIAPDGSKHWRVSLSVKNPSQVRATIILSALYVCESDTEPEPETEAEPGPDTSSCPKIIDPVGRGWVDPGAQLDHSLSRPAAKPFLHLRYRLHYARGDRLRPSKAESRPDLATESCREVMVTELEEQSQLRALVLQPKYLVDFHTSQDDVNYSIAGRDQVRCRAERDDDVREYYSVTEQNVHWAGWAPAQAQQTP